MTLGHLYNFSCITQHKDEKFKLYLVACSIVPSQGDRKYRSDGESYLTY